MEGNQTRKKPANGIGHRHKRKSSRQVLPQPLPPMLPTNYVFTENALQEVNHYIQDTIATASCGAKRSKADNRYRAIRAVQSATKKNKKALGKAAKLRKNNASLKKQLDATTSAIKSSEHQRYVDSELHRETAFNSKEPSLPADRFDQSGKC